jgi:hypothetical protein
MVELLYGAKDFDRIAWREIDEGRPVALRITGSRKALIHRILTLYAESERASRDGTRERRPLFGLAWRAMFAPSIVGLCNHARLAGMTVVVQDKGSTLEVRFEKLHAHGFKTRDAS